MKLFKEKFSILVVALFLMIGCSNSQSPVEPVNNEQTINRSMIAVYDVVIDPDAETIMITLIRNVQYHFPLTQIYPESLQIVGFSFENPSNSWVDIKLKHPLPNSGIDVFDPRVIAILEARPGEWFNYPFLGISGNNRVVKNPDGYTHLFDWVAPEINGNVNPFMAYFKNEPYRRWSSTEETDETKRWYLNLGHRAGPTQFKLVVDISTNYPDLSQPIVDNATEPIEIFSAAGDGLREDGGTTEVTVVTLGWNEFIPPQTFIEVPYLFNGAKRFDEWDSILVHWEGQPFRWEHRIIISNERHVPADEYNYIIASRGVDGVYLFKEFTLVVYP